MAGLEIRDLVKQYPGNSRRALGGIDLSVANGEYLVLLGPSGCGKSTLLRTIAGLEQPTSGTVSIGETDVSGLPPRARKIAMVFQSYALYPHKSVLANIVFPLKAAGVPKGERADKARAAARMFEIEHLLDRKPRQLSGGERQRVALARALVREPDIFLLDEPLSNLDAKLRASARDELRHFHAQVATTTVYVTHDQVEAMGLGDRIAVMKDGKIRQLGTPAEIYDRPADTFVATFIGSPPMNLIPNEGRLLGFRPEHLLPDIGDVAKNTIQLHVDRIEYLSGDRHVHCSVPMGDGQTGKVISRLPANVTTPISAGDDVEFEVAWSHLHYFDAESGKRVETE